MENASNALLIAASILIAVMVVSFGTYLFTTFNSSGKQINQSIEAKQKDEFNEQFYSYETDMSDYTTYRNVYDIVSVINLAQNNNEKVYKDGEAPSTDQEKESINNLYIYVTVNGTKMENMTTDALNKYISEHNQKTEVSVDVTKGNERYDQDYSDFSDVYNCTIETSGTTGYVKHIDFQKINSPKYIVRN